MHRIRPVITIEPTEDPLISKFILKDPEGFLELHVTNLGGAIMSVLLKQPGDASPVDVVLGFDDPLHYKINPTYFGVLVGRVANRISDGTFVLEGKKVIQGSHVYLTFQYHLPINNPPNSLHGGFKGFSYQVWTPEVTLDSLTLRLESPDEDQGFPGLLKTQITYSILAGESAPGKPRMFGIGIDYAAEVFDSATIVNLTNHSYFNLAGHESGDILGHELELFCDHYTPIDKNLIPTGAITPVAGTPFDFTKPKLIGRDISLLDPITNGGYDHNFVLKKASSDFSGHPQIAARAVHKDSGRVLEVFTTQPGVQLYTSNFLDGTLLGKNKTAYKKYQALCLETQGFPDAINHSHFPSIVLKPGEKYQESTIFNFYTLA